MAAPEGSNFRTSLYGGTDFTTTVASDYQFQLKTLLFGTGTSYLVMAAQGIMGRNTRSSEAIRPSEDGSFTTVDYTGSRTVVFTVTVQTTAALLQTKVDDWMTAWTATNGSDDPLVFKLPDSRGAGGSRIWRLFGRPRRMDVDYKLWSKGVATIKAEFYCADPRVYLDAVTNVPTSSFALPAVSWGLAFAAAPLGVTSGGLTFGSAPLGVTAAGLTFGAVLSSSSSVINNAGTTNAPWFAKITGPISNPAIKCGTNTIQFSGSLGSNEFIVVDSMNRNAWLNGDASQSWYPYVSPQSDWWSLAPGNNTVQFIDDGIRSGSPISTGTMSFEYRSAWM
ncbi:Siphovirus-type tail component [uncultured Caudovirales phage]|uniref:Siphovirus-type tail component n=1 Tax=uncultured Caudovirales phage TaxID=2100421 RepID=A0A6J5Q4Q5_9CAUD|nr:Siphovirus-type tail component [uncultured Caudovirales phage]